MDHIVPHAKGGKTTFENLRVACRACNTAKADGRHTEAEQKEIWAKMKRKKESALLLRVPFYDSKIAAQKREEK